MIYWTDFHQIFIIW